MTEKVQKFNTIGDFTRDQILNTTNDNNTILKNVLKSFPNAKTTLACIAWYKSDLRKKGLLGGGNVQRRLDGIKTELEFLKNRKSIESKILELEAKLKELQPETEEVK